MTNSVSLDPNKQHPLPPIYFEKQKLLNAGVTEKNMKKAETIMKDFFFSEETSIYEHPRYLIKLLMEKAYISFDDIVDLGETRLKEILHSNEIIPLMTRLDMASPSVEHTREWKVFLQSKLTFLK